MSLLADLLSKNKAGAHGDKKSPSTHNIPPTLSKAHGAAAKAPKIKKRYIAVTLAALTSIVFGALLTAKLRSVDSAARKKMSRLHSDQATGSAKSEAVNGPLPGAAAPSVATPSGEQAVKPRISLEEPAAPAPVKKTTVPHKTVLARCPPQSAKAKPSVPQKPLAAVPPAPIEQPSQPAHAQPRPKAIAPLTIDTAARDSLLYAARSAEQLSDWKTALANYRKAEGIDPGNYKIMSNLAAVYNNLGMFDEGASEAERALSRKPDYVPALINAAIGYSNKGNLRKAVRLFTSASAIDPSNRSVILNLGILHERSGNLDEAQATYRQLANAGDPMALEGMGRIYERKGNKSEAARAYRQILRTASATPALRREVKGRLERVEE